MQAVYSVEKSHKVVFAVQCLDYVLLQFSKLLIITIQQTRLLPEGVYFCSELTSR